VPARLAIGCAALLLVLPTACGGDGLERFPVESSLVGSTLEQVALRPDGGKRPLLVLLHGRGMEPQALVTDALRVALDDLGERAPIVLMANGGDHSYFHDRRDGRWGSYLLREVIPAAVRRLGADGTRVAIGGFSMGGFGALDLARLAPRRFCAVGGHSPAIFRAGAETPVGAFDDAEEFRRHDVFGAARPSLYGHAAVWLDVGNRDPFLEPTRELGKRLAVPVHVWPGDHGPTYFRRHVRDYLRFYADSLAEEKCRQQTK
jgi:enterochelin esterase-like enzyme